MESKLDLNLIAMLKISDQVQDFGKKWRITKMLRSQTFETDFTRAKSAVLELKSARDEITNAGVGLILMPYSIPPILVRLLFIWLFFEG